ncbi:hypothetical protein BGZ80_004038 [Entomortierella chlamydospora]|uniref:Uncharacterized protein n=1 Tax=Entomortierella chlamydospora TaxID=101097 RepID=A0A9P6SWB4_9FUNG|nr:hypothetical protein BGZ79_000972 [Entomortierella chlamydospora]KAG0007956.1 hypothetical protein BGZ80_004038 [Entomortierella chlamydospora]
MNYMYERRSVNRYRRDIPPQSLATAPIASPTDDPHIKSMMHTEKVMIITAAALALLLLVVALILFYVCMKRRHASRRIGQLQEFLPSPADEKMTEGYFKKQNTTISSASTLVHAPNNAHHRTRSDPITFAKGYYKGRINSNSKNDDGPEEEFQQISLANGFVESDDEIALKKSLSAGPRVRSLTVTIPSPTLHRSVSLNSHGTSGYISRSAPIEEESTQDVSDADPLPTAANFRLAKANFRDYSNSSRFSAGLNYPSFRRSSSSVIEFDVSQLKTASNMSDTKKHTTRLNTESSDESDDDDTISTASSDSFGHLPAHQKHHNFETHNPYICSGDNLASEEAKDTPGPAASPLSSQYIQHHATYTSPAMLPPIRKVEGIVFKETAQLLPSRIVASRTQGQQEMDCTTDDVEIQNENPISDS